jgi:hypothetical protein
MSKLVIGSTEFESHKNFSSVELTAEPKNSFKYIYIYIESESDSHCDWRSVSQYVLVSSPIIGLLTIDNFFFFFTSQELHYVGIAGCQWLRSEPVTAVTCMLPNSNIGSKECVLCGHMSFVYQATHNSFIKFFISFRTFMACNLASPKLTYTETYVFTSGSRTSVRFWLKPCIFNDWESSSSAYLKCYGNLLAAYECNAAVIETKMSTVRNLEAYKALVILEVLRCSPRRIRGFCHGDSLQDVKKWQSYEIYIPLTDIVLSPCMSCVIRSEK